MLKRQQEQEKITHANGSFIFIFFRDHPILQQFCVPVHIKKKQFPDFHNSKRKHLGLLELVPLSLPISEDLGSTSEVANNTTIVNAKRDNTVMA